MKRLHGSYGAATLTVAEAKAALRRRMRAVRRRLRLLPWSAGVPPALLRDAGETPADRDKVLATYAPQGSEVDPSPLIEALVGAGWTPCLPRAADRESPLSFHAVNGPLVPDAFGIPAPLPTSPHLTPNLIIVPVLAFDRAGGRLGQGAGCYDRTIAVLRATSSVRVIGLAYAGQEVARIPTDEHDQRLDGILTDAGFVEVVDASA